MDLNIRDWLIEARCIDAEMAAATSDAWRPEDSGEIEGEELAIGASVEGPLDEAGATTRFYFRAEEGREYLIEVVWDELSSVRVELTDDTSFSRVRQRNRQPLELLWTALKSGEYDLNVTSGSGTGTYTVAISVNAQGQGPQGTVTSVSAVARAATSGPSATPEPTVRPLSTGTPVPTVPASPTAAPTEATPPGPTTVRFAIEGTAKRVSWQAVEGAEDYSIYHDDFFDSGCSLDVFGSPSFCEELVTNVVETGYLHTEPAGEENYYWVVACNQGGCSEIVSEDPAKQGEPGTEE